MHTPAPPPGSPRDRGGRARREPSPRGSSARVIPERAGVSPAAEIEALLEPHGAGEDDPAASVGPEQAEVTEASSVSYRGFALDRFQAEAIQHIREGRSVLVSAPTGTGKTIIADYVVDKALEEGREVIYTAPIKALSNQKYRDYTRLYGKDRIGLVTGDLVIHQDAQIRIMTTEILRNILLQGNRSLRLSHVIVDEVHFLDDEERGTVWEEVLIYLPPEVKIVALSATLPNIAEFAEWLEYVRGERVEVVLEKRRAVPLKLLLANGQVGIRETREFDREFNRWLDHKRQEQRAAPEPAADRARGFRRPGFQARERKKGYQTRHFELVELASPDYLPLLYFIFSRRQTELFARELSRRTRRSFLNRSERAHIEQQLQALEAQYPEVLTEAHWEMYLNGIAFHHAGLHVALKALVEELYEQKLIKVLYCTSTFALGINMPARTVIFDALRKFNGHTVAPLTVRQFLQKAGRAGRRGMDRVGYVLIREDFADYAEDRRLLGGYQRGDNERIQSAFNLSFSSVVNLLHRFSYEEIQRFLDKSFLNFSARKSLEQQRGHLDRLQDRLDPPAPEGRSPRPGLLKRWKKQASRLERQLSSGEGLIHARFIEKVDFLKAAGYLNDDGTFNAGARALMHVQISEIFVTELLLAGVFDEAQDDELFGILTGLVQELPRSATVREARRGRWATLAGKIRRVRESEIVTRAEALINVPVVFSPELMPFGQLWVQGHSLASLMLMIQSDIDISGDLVGAFRRAKDLAGQIRQACHEDERIGKRLTRLIQVVSRDEVEVLD